MHNLKMNFYLNYVSCNVFHLLINKIETDITEYHSNIMYLIIQ